ncbi:hypothetical protein [Bradyrhizobium sp. 153]|uniref:hypothetical protein n=1 Tax=Bradyrhizobium sp. 153 TaxID=2782627 RepID=UPI001FFA8ADA|nr:hypothetical protein [Bradyrhizobium sp. 153]
MIHDVQVQSLKVGDFSRNMNRENLAYSIRRELGPKRKPIHDQAGFRRPTTLGHEAMMGRYPLAADRKLLNSQNIVLIQPIVLFEFQDERSRQGTGHHTPLLA